MIGRMVKWLVVYKELLWFIDAENAFFERLIPGDETRFLYLMIRRGKFYE